MDQKQILTVVLMVSMFVVGMAVMDDLASKAAYPTSVTGETVNTDTSTTVTLNNYPVVDDSYTVKNDTTELTDETDYTITTETGVFTLLNGDYNNTDLTVDYQYESDEYFDNSLSRTIVRYIVPIGLLTMLALVVFI